MKIVSKKSDKQPKQYSVSELVPGRVYRSAESKDEADCILKLTDNKYCYLGTGSVYNDYASIAGKTYVEMDATLIIGEAL